MVEHVLIDTFEKTQAAICDAPNIRSLRKLAAGILTDSAKGTYSLAGESTLRAAINVRRWEIINRSDEANTTVTTGINVADIEVVARDEILFAPEGGKAA